MDTRSSAEFWYDVVGGTDDEDSDFEGFTEADLLKIDPADGESDLDIDFQAVQHEFDTNDSESDNGSNVDLLPRRDWSTHLHSVSDDKFTENVGVCHYLEVGAEPLQFFQLFFSGLCVQYDRHRDKSICGTSAGRKEVGFKMASDHS